MIDIIAQILTAIAVRVALAIWYFTHQREQQANTIGHSAELLLLTVTADHVARSDFILNRLVSSGEPIDPDSVGEQTEQADLLLRRSVRAPRTRDHRIQNIEASPRWDDEIGLRGL